MREGKVNTKEEDCAGEQRYGQRNALCHEYVVYGDDVDLVDALRLELVILLDVSGRLRAARGRECPRHANLLFAFVDVSAFYVKVGEKQNNNPWRAIRFFLFFRTTNNIRCIGRGKRKPRGMR